MFTKIHLKKSDFFFAARISLLEWPAIFLSHVQRFIHFLFFYIYLSTAKPIARFRFSSQIKTYCKTPVAFKVLIKHIKFPRLYSFSLFHFFDVFQESACSPSAVKNRVCRNNIEICNVLETHGKPMVFNDLCAHGHHVCRHLFLSRLCSFDSRIFKATSGHFDRSFFFRCPEVGLGIPKPTKVRLWDFSF